MVLNKIKSYLMGDNSTNSDSFSKILNNLSLDKNNDSDLHDIHMIKKGFDIGYTAHKGQVRKSGEEYFNHCVSVALQLSDWNMDKDVVIAGLLHDTLEDTDLTKAEIVQNFNEDIANLVEGVSKLSDITREIFFPILIDSTSFEKKYVIAIGVGFIVPWVRVTSNEKALVLIMKKIIEKNI